jgi:hypothetical protein
VQITLLFVVLHGLVIGLHVTEVFFDFVLATNS